MNHLNRGFESNDRFVIQPRPIRQGRQRVVVRIRTRGDHALLTSEHFHRERFAPPCFLAHEHRFDRCLLRRSGVYKI
jgi:hypothetical protein